MAKKKTQQARVLAGFELDGVQYNPDDVIEASPKMIEQLASSVDAHPSAVEHCLGLKSPVIKKHEAKIDEIKDPDSDPDKNPDPDQNEDMNEDQDENKNPDVE
ncbi:hypothetical protein [Nitrosomonas sp.]|uniref:hypothetical protein n=1 Tax=Nitrosomonas sp. TaxID=42353 RepID=UPI0025E5CA54|nr:hypothetical protein [Nitrosomonas sp.]